MKDFHNPAIMDQIATLYNIQQKGTNLSQQLYDPSLILKTDDYRAIAAKQQRLAEREEERLKRRTQIAFEESTLERVKRRVEIPTTEEALERLERVKQRFA